MRASAHIRLLSLGLGLGWLLAPSATRAQAPFTFAFEWSAPEGCPSAALVQTEIDNLLGSAARDRVRQNLAVQATVDHPALWQVTLATQSGGASGHRTIEAGTCQGLASATALIVALMIDPDAVAAHASQAKAATPEPAPVPAAPPPPPRPVRATFGFVGLGAAGHLGVLPGPDVGIGATLGISRRHWRVELRAAYGPRQVQSEALADPAGAYGKFRFLAGTLAGCWLRLHSAVDLGPCAEAEIGAVQGEGIGADHSSSRTTPWFGLGAGGAAVLKATPWLHFSLHADAVVPLWRPHFVFENVPSPIFRTWPVGGRLTALAEVHF